MLGGPLLLMASGGGGGVTARSVVFDIADNWGDAQFINVRSVEFKSGGSVLTMPSTDFTSHATSFSSSYSPEFSFDTSLSKIGSAGNTSWLSGNFQNSNQRLIIVFDTAQTFDEIVINNGHNSGSATSRGAKTVKITTTPDVYSTTTYNAEVTSGTVLNTSEWPQHVAANTADDQTVWTA